MWKQSSGDWRGGQLRKHSQSLQCEMAEEKPTLVPALIKVDPCSQQMDPLPKHLCKKKKKSNPNKFLHSALRPLISVKSLLSE